MKTKLLIFSIGLAILSSSVMALEVPATGNALEQYKRLCTSEQQQQNYEICYVANCQNPNGETQQQCEQTCVQNACLYDSDNGY